MLALSTEEKAQVGKWLRAAFRAASSFNGSEPSEKKLFEPLNLFDQFVRAHNANQPSNDLEQEIAELSYPDRPPEMPLTVGGFLDLAAVFYERLKNVISSADIWIMLENGGAVIQESDKVFVKTGEGKLKTALSDAAVSYEIRERPRLAMLIAYLRNDGVNGQAIFTDDLVITKGRASKNMVRTLPYHVVQIPRLDMEIAVCDQVGETTFVKKGTVGAVFWDSLSKEELKARGDVAHIDHRSDQQWWKEIKAFLSGQSDPAAKKINVRSWSGTPPKLDIGLIKDSLLKHRQATGEWLTTGKKGPSGNIAGYILEHGPYAGLTINTLNNALQKAGRGLPEGWSIARLNAEISREHGLDYVDYSKQEYLDIGKIKDSLLLHRQTTGEWLSGSDAEEGGEKGSYVLEHGPYAGKITTGILNAALLQGSRGLPGKISIAQLNAEISREHKLDYVNRKKQEKLETGKVKESLLAHRLATGEWLSNGKPDADGKKSRYLLEHGPYAGKMTVRALDVALSKGLRGLPGGLSIAQLNKEISNEYGLDYVHRLEQEDFDLEKVKESLLAHRRATGKWLLVTQAGQNGKKGSYILEHGPYAGVSVATLSSALSIGGRGLPGDSSIAKLNREISSIHGLDYVYRLEPEDLDLEKAKQCLLAHYQATGEWLSCSRREGEKRKNYILEYGPYAGLITVKTLDVYLSKGLRGLPGGSSIAKLNAEIKAQLEQSQDLPIPTSDF